MPDQGLNPGPPHWEHGVLSTAPLGKSLNGFFFNAMIAPKEKWVLNLVSIDQLLSKRVVSIPSPFSHEGKKWSKRALLKPLSSQDTQDTPGRA